MRTATLALALEGGPTPEVASISVDSLEPSPNHPRTVFTEEVLQGLTESIRAQGIIQPLVVRPFGGGRYQIVCGERRWRAAKSAGLAEVPAVCRNLDDDDSFSQSLAENIARESLSAIDEVRAVARLASTYGGQEAARRLGKPHTWVSKRKRIAEAPEFVLEFLSTGASTDIEAHYELAKLADGDAEAARSIIENHTEGGHLRDEVKTASRAVEDDTGGLGDRRSHANGSAPSEEFRLDSREAAAAAANNDSSDEDSDAEGDEGQDGSDKGPPEQSWRPSDAPELDEPFDSEVPVLVTAVEARRAGHIVLTTSNGPITYELTEQARVQLRALLEIA